MPDGEEDVLKSFVPHNALVGFFSCECVSVCVRESGCKGKDTYK